MLDLGVVMPVFNEEGCIVKVVRSWTIALSALGIQFRLFILNDGSKDGTKEALEAFKSDYRVEIINKQNSGHGSTILMGYQKAVKVADWTFQCDSDDEMKPDYFNRLWARREDFDALFGSRTDREQNIGRKLISAYSRGVVRIFFGTGVYDVNTPYRLIRSHLLEQIVNQIPADTFAPNVIISGVLNKYKLRIFEYPVPHENRKTGKVSIVKWKLWESAAKAFWQTLLCRITLRDVSYRHAQVYSKNSKNGG